MAPAILIGVCEVLRDHFQLTRSLDAVLHCLGGFLRPAALDFRSASTNTRSSPVQRPSPRQELGESSAMSKAQRSTLVLVARCLTTLPSQLWDDKVSEQAMGAILSGLGHADDAVRKAVRLI